MDKIPISIIAGHLGSGKTTLLKNIIGKLDRKFAIIMNEFGDINVDKEVIKGKNVNVAELTGGCVCCSLTGEFEEAVKEVIEKYNPEIIIVETTGVAEPDALVVDVSENIDGVVLDSVITVVDADGILRFESIGRTGAAQIEMADVIVLNKLDLITEGQRVEAKVRVRQFNEKAPILETTQGEVDIDLLFGLEVDHHLKNIHEGHETTFESFTYTFEKAVDREQFEQFLLGLPKQVFRLKGFIEFVEDGIYFLNYVAGRWTLEEHESDQRSLVFIGEELNAVKGRVIRLLQQL